MKALLEWFKAKKKDQKELKRMREAFLKAAEATEWLADRINDYDMWGDEDVERIGKLIKETRDYEEEITK